MGDDVMSDEPQQTPIAESPQTPGQILRAARESQGYQQTEVAKQLRLNVQTIIDIENDHYIRAAVYLRGYLRAYAKLVAVDPVIVLAAYEVIAVDEVSDTKVSIMLAQGGALSYRLRPKRRKSLLWVSSSVLLVLIMMMVLWWQEQHYPLYTVSHQNVPLATTSKVIAKPLSVAKELTVESNKGNTGILHSQVSSKKQPQFVPDYSIKPVDKSS